MKMVLSFLLLFSLNTVANERGVKSTARPPQNPQTQFSLKVYDDYYWGRVPPATEKPPPEIVAQVRADCAKRLSHSDNSTATAELDKHPWIVTAQCWDRHLGKRDQVEAIVERTPDEEKSMREAELEAHRSRIPVKPRHILVETLIQQCWEYYDQHRNSPNDLQQPGGWGSSGERSPNNNQMNLAICRIYHGQRQEKLVGINFCSNKDYAKDERNHCPDKDNLRPPGFRDRAIERCIQDWSDPRQHRDELQYTMADTGSTGPDSEDDHIGFKYQERSWFTMVHCWTHPASDQTLHVAMTAPDWIYSGEPTEEDLDPGDYGLQIGMRSMINQIFRYALLHLLI
jgi:hypothetical protein